MPLDGVNAYVPRVYTAISNIMQVSWPGVRFLGEGTQRIQGRENK